MLPTERFTGRAQDYARYRPGYPGEIVDILQREIEFDSTKIIADVGSGTGLLTRVFLAAGNRVFGVEPNAEMRSFAERELAQYTNFVSVNGTAENTGLPDNSMDLVTVGTALHWFDREKSRREFSRIAKKNGYLLIANNNRRKDEGIMREYERIILKYEKEPESRDPDDGYIREFLGTADYKKFSIPNEQLLDSAGLLGRIVSASYMPKPDEKGFEEMKKELEDVFGEFEQGGKVKLLYSTILFIGLFIGL